MTPLDIYADPICPWCYIAKARLERALESRPTHPFNIRWHPFRLMPDMPAEGMDREAYLGLLFGDTKGILDAYAPVIKAAEETGLALNLPAITRTPNTLDAHRLIHWAGLEGRQNAMVNALFRAYFTEGLDIGAREVLLDLAARVGLSRDMVARLFDAGADTDLIKDADAAARERGIQSVPFFIIAGQHAVAGAQTVSLWQNVIDELTKT